jgi:uncharacterized protein YuzB (UPF0349 family)
MNEFKTCNICQGFDHEEVVKRLKELDPNATIIIGCQGMCAVGATKPFVIVNGIPVIGDTIDIVIEKVSNTMNKN